MNGILVNVVWQGKKEAMRINPNIPLSQLRDDVCSKWKISDSSRAVFLKPGPKKQQFDMSIPFRLVGLSNGQTLELSLLPKPNTNSNSSSTSYSSLPVQIAVQMPNNKRITFQVENNRISLWDLLLAAEREAGLPGGITRVKSDDKKTWMQPVVVFLNRETSNVQSLRTITLLQLGVTPNSAVLFRVNLKPTQIPFDEIVAQIDLDDTMAISLKNQSIHQNQSPSSSPPPPPQKQQETISPPVVTPISTPTTETQMLVINDEERMRRLEQIAEKERKQAEKMEVEPSNVANSNVVVTPITTPTTEAQMLVIGDDERKRRMEETVENERKRAEQVEQETEELKRIQREQQAREREQGMLERMQLDDRTLNEQREIESNINAEMLASQIASTMSQAQNQAQGDVPEEERNVIVFPPSDQSFDPNMFNNIPDDFYELTTEDLQGILETERKSKAEATVLMTREMREKLKSKQWKQFKRCTIRVRFPDRVEIQRSFLPSATISDLETVVKSCLLNPENEFILFTTPPMQTLGAGNTTLLKRQLVPAALVHLKWKNPSSVTHPFLKPELMSRISERLPPNWTFIPPSTANANAHTTNPNQTPNSSVRCAGCLSEQMLSECLECGNSFCASCWNLVHQDDLSGHHKKSSNSTSTSSHQSSNSKQNTGVPKWFARGKKF